LRAFRAPLRLGVVRVATVALALSGAWRVSSSMAQTPAERMTAESRALTRAARLEREGRPQAAIEEVEGLLERYPDSVSGLAVLQRLRSEEGRARLLLPYAERAVEVSGGRMPPLLQLWIRALMTAGEQDSATAAAVRWTRESPQEAMSFLELSQVLRQRGRTEEAIETLTRGRRSLGAPDAFAQELGQLQLAAGAYEDAARNWVVMLAWGVAGRDVVARQLADAIVDPERAKGALWRELERPDARFKAVRSGIEFALRLPDPEAARRLVGVAVDRVPRETRLALLRDFTLAAANRGLFGQAAWGASRLAREAPSVDERLQWRAMAADFALNAGDEVWARAEFEVLLGQARPGTEAHRTALRRSFELSLDDPELARERFEEFGRRYPADGEALAAMAVELAEGDLGRGDLKRAAADLALVRSPTDPNTALRVARSRGLLSLFGGRPGLAKARLEEAAEVGGAAASRSSVIEMLEALRRADSVEAVAFGAALLRLRSDPAAAAAGSFLDAWKDHPASRGRPALLMVAARELAAQGLGEEAARLRTRVVERFPAAPEAPSALLDLARFEANGNGAAARAHLESLIVSYPGSALAPVARRMLAELGGAVPSS